MDLDGGLMEEIVAGITITQEEFGKTSNCISTHNFL